jgi:exopolysaccharide production protein ExoZ
MKPPETADLTIVGRPRTLAFIQVLRGLAAVLVMFYHYAHYLSVTIPGRDIGNVLFAGGYAGVDVFFYISGFIIVYSTERTEHANPVDFSIRRFFRVVPLAQVATLAYFAILFTRPSAVVFWQSLFFIPRGFTDPPKFGFPVVPQEWTLTYEILFYALFAVALTFAHRRRVLAVSTAIVSLVVGMQWILGGAFTLRPNRMFPSPEYHGIVRPELLGVIGNPIMLDFILGMVLAVAYLRFEKRLKTRRWAVAERIIGLVMIGVFLASYMSRENPGNGLLDKGAGAACLVIGALLLEVSTQGDGAPRPRGRFFAVFLWLGTISYPLYLVHAGIAERTLRRICSFCFGIGVGGAWGVLALVALSLAIASGAHIILERPLIRAGKHLVSLRRHNASPARSPKRALD